MIITSPNVARFSRFFYGQITKKTPSSCKNSRFEPPFGGLIGIALGSSSLARWKVHCRLPVSVVIIKRFSLALTAETLLSEIYRNRRFLKGWVTLNANFIDGDVSRNSSMDR